MKVREIAYPSDNFSHYIFYTINLLVKIRVQLQLGKVLVGHLRIFQRILRKESRDLGKTNTVTVITGYLTVLLDRNDVTNTHRRTVKIRWLLQIKLLI